MAQLLRRAPPILIYTTVSAGLLAVVVARALDTYQNFFASAFALSHSNGSILVMANTAFLMLYLFGRALQAMFFGTLRPVEIERLYQRGGFFVTDFMLAFATFREAFGISSGVMVSVLLFVKCFHWLLSDRIEAMDQLPYPGPSRLEHARLIALLLVLWVCDSILLTYSLDAVMQQGIGLVVLFAAEYAILMVNLTQSLLKYILCVTEIRRAHRVGGAIAPPWEDKTIYGFYIELSTAFVELTIYLTYFAIMSIHHSIPIYAIRDVYVAGSLFITRSLAFVRYKRAMQALDVFDSPTQEELDSKSDKTCIVCREELNAIPAEGEPPAAPATPGPELDTSNGPPKRLPCGHIFHRNCLRSWFERQLTCPTCRQRVDDKLARANIDAARVGAGVGGNNHGGDAALPQQPGVPGGGAQVNNRRAAANAVNRTQAAEIVQGQMREPLRFEGFYLQAGAFVPWVGGPLLARDPTQPNAPHRHTPVPQRARHPATGAHLPMPAPAVSGPPTAAIQSPPIATATPTASFVWPLSTSAPPGSSTQPGEKPSSEAKPKVAEDDDDDDDDSDSDNSADLLTSEERRRVIAEAALQRAGSTAYQRLGNPPGGLSPTPTTTTPSTSTPAPTSTSTAVPALPTVAADTTPTRTPSEREKAYGKYFAMPTESSTMPIDSTQLTPSAKPMSFLAPRHSIASAPLSGDYNVRHDAPSFVPLFHSFHLPHYSAAVGPSRPWPLQKASLPTQTLSLPGQTAPQTSVHAAPSLQTYANAVNAMRTAPYPLRVTPQSPSSLQLQHHHPSMPSRSESLFSRSNVKREPSPSHELTIQQIEVITRIQVEERLRVLENVKRMTQQCIDELMAVKGTMPNLEASRQRTEETKPVVEPQSIFAAETSLSSVGPLEQVSSTSTPVLKALGPLLTDVKPIVEPEIVLAAEAPASEPVLSVPSTSNIMVVDPLSLSVTEESTEVAAPIKQEEVPTLLYPEAVPVEGTGEVPLVEGDSAESVHLF